MGQQAPYSEEANFPIHSQSLISGLDGVDKLPRQSAISISTPSTPDLADTSFRTLFS